MGIRSKENGINGSLIGKMWETILIFTKKGLFKNIITIIIHHIFTIMMGKLVHEVLYNVKRVNLPK